VDWERATSGSAFLSTAGDWSSSNNITSDLKALNPNLKDSAGIIGSYDANLSLGGPIVKDKLWFYGSYRKLDTSVPQDGIVANKYTGDPSHWDWAPDNAVSSRLVQGRSMMIGRVTGQFGKNRARFYSEYQTRCEGSSLTVDGDGCHKRGDNWIGLGNNQAPTQMSPEATSTAGRGYFDVPFYVNQGTWTNTASNKLLFDAGIQFFRYQPIFGHPSPDAVKGLIPVTQQSNAINPATGIPFAPVANYRYRAVESWGPAKGKTDDATGSVSYVTGANNMKVGYQYRMLDLQDDDLANDTLLGYRFNGLTPNAVSYYLPEMGRRTITKTHGLYLQDTWTLNRLTVQGALRWDRASSFAPVEGNGTFGKSSFLNPQPITIAETEGVNAYNDLTPRVGVAYDVFGNGKTAVKLNWGKYLAYAANDSPYTSTNPGATIVRSVTNRGWNASVAAGGNGDLVVDCNLLNPDANGDAGRSRGVERLGRASRRHADDGHAAAGAAAARLGRLQLHAPQVQRLLRDGRPEPQHRDGVRELHADGTAGFAPGRWRRIPGGGVRADGCGQCARDADDSAPRVVLRRRARQHVGRLRSCRQRPDAEWSDDAARHQHGPRQGQHLRHGDEVQQRDQRGARHGRRSERARLQQRRAVADDAARVGQLHAAENRRAHQRGGPLTAERAARRHAEHGGHLAGAELGHPGGARSSAARRNGHGHDQHPVGRQRASRLRRRTPDAARHALREDPPLRSHAHGCRCRHQQRDELELCTGVEQHLHLQHRQRPAAERLGHPDQHRQPAVRAPELHGEFLVRAGRQVGGPFWPAFFV
jgi:hypothetical protein